MKQGRSAGQIGKIEHGPFWLLLDVVPNDSERFIREVRIYEDVEIIRDSATHQSQYSV